MKRRHLNRFAVAACAFGVAAAAGSAAADTKVAYSCADGSVLIADFGMSEGRVALTYGRRRVALSPVRTGSGAKYTNDKTTFWTKGKEARLLDSGRQITCRVIEE